MTVIRSFPLLCCALFAAVYRLTVSAAVTVNAPLTITHRVEVQPIRVGNAAGATVPGLGTATEEAYIKEQINRIWAQAGVRIDWLPFASYTNDFAYDGSPANYTTTARPLDDFDTILSNALSPPKSADVRTLNLFFVEICPGFNRLSESFANGLANVDGNGVAAHIGRTLLTFESGRDVIASVLAHEIGHNLGLNHAGSADNVMAASGGTSSRLTAAQKDIVFTNDPGNDGFELLRPAVTNYSLWVQANGVTQGPEGDDDLDGLTNVVEFMFNLNPRAFSALPVPLDTPAGKVWTLPKRQEALSDGMIYRVRTSSDMQTWIIAGPVVTGATVLQDDSSVLVVRLNRAQSRRFMRLDVSVPAQP